MKGRNVCITARSPPASLSLTGKVTKHTTVKWAIVILAVCFQHQAAGPPAPG